jgi:nucleoside-diphosphate-sugar epimerase
MNVLLTGASSFTGLWFAESLAAVGLRVVAPLHHAVNDYQGRRRIRVDRLAKVAEIIECCPFGSEAFLSLMRAREIDALCHHAAQVTDYKSLDFNVTEALLNNTRNLQQILASAKGLRAIVLTGSVFEADEGLGAEPREAFSPYGLSKTLTGAVFRYWCGHYKIPLTRFVIANPFGPYEEPRFGHYLMTCWARGEKAIVKTPDYIRDNVPVSLLAKSYADCVRRILQGEVIAHLAPSFYAEAQAAFAQRSAREMVPRLNLDCGLEFLPQVDFAEPLARVNTDKLDGELLGWDEKAAWDSLAAYYRATYGL